MSADLTRGAMTEFQEKLRQQHEESMHRELEALLKTAGEAEAEVRTGSPGYSLSSDRRLSVEANGRLRRPTR